MPLIYNIQNTVIAIILISIILFYLLSHGGRRQAQDSIFVSLLISTLMIIIFEFGIDILTGKKTVLDYLLKPILKAKNNALRER